MTIIYTDQTDRQTDQPFDKNAIFHNYGTMIQTKLVILFKLFIFLDISAASLKGTGGVIGE